MSARATIRTHRGWISSNYRISDVEDFRNILFNLPEDDHSFVNPHSVIELEDAIFDSPFLAAYGYKIPPYRDALAVLGGGESDKLIQFLLEWTCHSFLEQKGQFSSPKNFPLRVRFESDIPRFRIYNCTNPEYDEFMFGSYNWSDIDAFLKQLDRSLPERDPDIMHLLDEDIARERSPRNIREVRDTYQLVIPSSMFNFEFLVGAPGSTYLHATVRIDAVSQKTRPNVSATKRQRTFEGEGNVPVWIDPNLTMIVVECDKNDGYHMLHTDSIRRSLRARDEFYSEFRTLDPNLTANAWMGQHYFSLTMGIPNFLARFLQILRPLQHAIMQEYDVDAGALRMERTYVNAIRLMRFHLEMSQRSGGEDEWSAILFRAREVAREVVVRYIEDEVIPARDATFGMLQEAMKDPILDASLYPIRRELIMRWRGNIPILYRTSLERSLRDVYGEAVPLIDTDLGFGARDYHDLLENITRIAWREPVNPPVPLVMPDYRRVHNMIRKLRFYAYFIWGDSDGNFNAMIDINHEDALVIGDLDKK